MVGIKALQSSLDFLREQRDGGLKRPAAVVGAAGVLSSAGSILRLRRALDQLGVDAFVYVAAGWVLSLASAVALLSLLWVFYTGGFYVIATFLFDAEGDFRALFRLVGWGFVGVLLSGVVTTLLGVLQAAAVGGVLFPVFGLVNATFLVVSILLWVQSVELVFHVGLKRSALAVILPVGFSMAVAIVPYL